MEYLGAQHVAGNYSKCPNCHYGNSIFSTRYGAWLCILSKIVAVFVVAQGIS